MQYRLLVIAPTVLDAVAGAGGFVFDQSMAGWHVMASVVGDDDTRPLDILGVGAVDLQSAVATMCSERTSGMIAMHAALDGHADVRRLLSAVDAEVLMWASHGETTLSHRLSHAACAFKARALAAAACSPRPVERTERFCTAVPVARRSGA